METPTSETGRTFTLDTKGSCFMCLKYDPSTTPVSPYSYHRLSKYVQVDFTNVYSISLPTVSISALENSEVVVTLCSQCRTEADKFVKLHKDFELVRKRLNTCVGRIQQLMLNANNDTALLQVYRQRLTSSANPMELIQANIAENLRKETIQKCTKLTGISPSPLSSTFPNEANIAITNVPKPATPSSTPPVTVTSTTSFLNESSAVSSTTIHPVTSGQEKEVLVVDLSDSEEEVDDNTTSELVISSVTGAAGAVYPSSNATVVATEQGRFPMPVIIGYSQSQPVTIQSVPPPAAPAPVAVLNVQPSSSYSALQSFTSGYDFNLRESGFDNTNANVQPTTSTSPPATVVSETNDWRKFSNGKAQCKPCGKIFRHFNLEILNAHALMHAGLKPVNCQHCSQMFRSGRNLKVHIYTHHKRHVFQNYRYPAVSNKAFQSAIDSAFACYMKRLPDQETDRPYYCMSCSKNYRHKADVDAHIITTHFNDVGSKIMEIQRQGLGPAAANFSNVNSDTGNITESPATIIKLVCLTCGLKFDNSAKLTKHLVKGCASGSQKSSQQQQEVTTARSVSKSTSFVIKWKCGICSEMFANQNELKRHKLQKHSKTSSTNSLLGGTTYKCQYCEKKFKFYYSQRVHMLTLHRHQIFSRYVPVGTTLEAIDAGVQLILEQSKTSSGRTHVCKFCNRDFTGSVASIVQNHILVNHYQEVVNRLKSAVEEAARLPCQEVGSSSAEMETEPDIKIENAVEVVLPD